MSRSDIDAMRWMLVIIGIVTCWSWSIMFVSLETVVSINAHYQMNFLCCRAYMKVISFAKLFLAFLAHLNEQECTSEKVINENTSTHCKERLTIPFLRCDFYLVKRQIFRNDRYPQIINKPFQPLPFLLWFLIRFEFSPCSYNSIGVSLFHILKISY